uniref:Uncharacterized protein n=1 Tax=Acrobeloides nanus TaxID=290746 RepID=A0A914DHA1_9BILA
MYAPVFALMLFVAYSTAIPTDTNEFCSVYSHLNLCKLKEVLEGALQEVQFVLSAQTAIPPQVQARTMVDKRKSAFVRFGKRSPASEESFSMP